MNIRVFSDSEKASVYAAASIEKLIKTKSKPILGLATGSTPIHLYRELIGFHKQGLSLGNVATINLDEYAGLSKDHPQSYYSFMNEHLFRYVDIPKEQTFLPQGDAADLSLECQRYDEIIQNYPIDIQILGIGVNGHIGFNEPNNSLKVGTHIVELAPETIEANSRFFSHFESVPTKAITVGLHAILRAKEIILLAFGEEKAQSVKEAILGDVRTNLPASILQIHPNVTFVLDQPAAHLFLKEENINATRNNSRNAS